MLQRTKFDLNKVSPSSLQFLGISFNFDLPKSKPELSLELHGFDSRHFLQQSQIYESAWCKQVAWEWRMIWRKCFPLTACQIIFRTESNSFNLCDEFSRIVSHQTFFSTVLLLSESACFADTTSNSSSGRCLSMVSLKPPNMTSSTGVNT